VLEVFASSAERQGAYDFLENEDVDAGEVAEAMNATVAGRCAPHSYVFVSIDGSSLTLTDHQRSKDFGAVGATNQGGRGLKVINAYAVSPQGVPLGILGQAWWARKPRPKRHDCHARPLADKETRHWVDVMSASAKVLANQAPETRAWFVIDREGDKRHCLEHLEALNGHWFTIRSCYNRRLHDVADRRYYIFDKPRSKRPLNIYQLEVTAGHGRKARFARMELRVAKVTLRIAVRRSLKFSEQDV